MRFSFNAWRQMIDAIEAEPFPAEEASSPGFPIHPSASELAEDMLVDPDVLKNETYEPGIYDEDGDYYPQYSDDPYSMPDFIAPNDLGGETALESSPADSNQPSDGSDSGKESNSQT